MRSRRPTPPTRRGGRATCRSLAGIPLGIKDLFATRGRRHHRRQPHPQGLQAALREHGQRQPAQGGRGDARQAQHGRVRDGLVERDQRLRAGDQPVAAEGQQCRPHAGRIVGRLGGGGRGGHRAGRDRHRHRRLDPPAGGLRRHLRDQADLRPLLALGDRRLRQLARPGRADGEDACATARSCSRRWPGSTRRIRPRSTCRCRSGKQNLSSDLSGKRVGIPKEYRIDGVPAEINALWDQGIEWLKDAGATPVEISLPAHQIRAADLLHHRPGRGLVQPRPL